METYLGKGNSVGEVVPFGWDDDKGNPFNPYDGVYMNRSTKYDLPDAIDVMLP